MNRARLMRPLALLLLCSATLLATAAPSPDRVLYPTGGQAHHADPAPVDPWGRAPWLIGSLALAAAGVWWMRRVRGRPGATGRRLAIEETRSLGSRQYLVVATCDGRRLLLGVAPGRINLLSDLGPGEPEGPS